MVIFNIICFLETQKQLKKPYKKMSILQISPSIYIDFNLMIKKTH